MTRQRYPRIWISLLVSIACVLVASWVNGLLGIALGLAYGIGCVIANRVVGEVFMIVMWLLGKG